MAFVMVLNPIGILISNIIFGRLFDSARSSNCVGESCYRFAFVVFCLFQLLPVGLSGILFWKRMREVRRRVKEMKRVKGGKSGKSGV
jgi:hypothetical protein